MLTLRCARKQVFQLINFQRRETIFHIAYELAMKELNPALYQNITSPDADSLPADVAQRYKQGLMWIDDLKAYEDCGFTGTAKQLLEMLLLKHKIKRWLMRLRAMKERNDKRDEYHEKQTRKGCSLELLFLLSKLLMR